MVAVAETRHKKNHVRGMVLGCPRRGGAAGLRGQAPAGTWAALTSDVPPGTAAAFQLMLILGCGTAVRPARAHAFPGRRAPRGDSLVKARTLGSLKAHQKAEHSGTQHQRHANANIATLPHRWLRRGGSCSSAKATSRSLCRSRAAGAREAAEGRPWTRQRQGEALGRDSAPLHGSRRRRGCRRGTSEGLDIGATRADERPSDRAGAAARRRGPPHGHGPR